MNRTQYIIAYSVIAIVGVVVLYYIFNGASIAKSNEVPDSFVLKPCSGTKPNNWPGVKYYKQDGKFFFFDQSQVGATPDVTQIDYLEYIKAFRDSKKDCSQIG